MNPRKSERPASPPQPSPSEVLAHLADSSQPIRSRSLASLSDLSTEGLELFDATWSRIDIERRRQIINRLSEMAEDNVELSFNAVFKHALSDPDAEVRKAAVEGLWEDDEPSLIRPLLCLLAEDSSPLVRQAAATALGRFALLAEHQKTSRDNADRLSQALLKVFKNAGEPLEVRRRALEAVSPLSLPEVTQAIWSAYRQEDPGLKASALFAMGRNCDLLWLPTILRELDSDTAELRYEAAAAAGELGEVEAVPQLVELVSDPDADVRLAVVQALGKIGGAEAKRTLRACLAHKSQAVREAAEQALEEMALFEEPISARGLGL